jgi:hypothetical protein
MHKCFFCGHPVTLYYVIAIYFFSLFSCHFIQKSGNNNSDNLAEKNQIEEKIERIGNIAIEACPQLACSPRPPDIMRIRPCDIGIVAALGDSVRIFYIFERF